MNMQITNENELDNIQQTQYISTYDFDKIRLKTREIVIRSDIPRSHSVNIISG